MTLALRDPETPDSPLARWDARWKLAGVFVAVLAIAVLETIAASAVAALAAFGAVLLARMPVSAIFGRIGLLLLAVIPVFCVVPLTQPATDAGWDLGFIRISIPGLLAAGAVGFRVLGIGLWGLILMRSGAFPHTLAAGHALFVPGVLVQIAQLAHRYTFLFTAEARRTRIALRTRAFRAKTDRHSYRTLSHATGGLLVRSADRAENVSAAMRCRGFRGEHRTLATFHTTANDVLGFAVVAVGAAALVVADRFGGS